MSDDTVGFGPVAERLESDGGTRLRRGGARGRRTVVAVVGGLGVVAAGGACLWAWQAWFAQGPQPSEALPSNTLAYVSIDLDPPGPQKIEALSFLKKFPSLKKDLGLDAGDDVRRKVFEEFASEGSCDSVKYADDIEPWIGQRAAVALVDQAQPEPVVVLQVTDADGAKPGLDALLDCAREGDQELGYVLDGDWAVLARSEKVARMVVEDAGKGTLADEKQFQDLTGAAGEPGIVTLYAAPEAGPALLEVIDHEPFAYGFLPMLTTGFDPMSGLFNSLGLLASTPDFETGAYDESGMVSDPELDFTKAEKKTLRGFEHFDELTDQEQKTLIAKQDRIMERHFENLDQQGVGEDRPSVDQAPETFVDEEFPEGDYGPELPAATRKALAEFSGLGGVVRFKDGGVEFEMVSDRIEGTFGNFFDGEAGDDIISGLPDGTSAAFGAGFGDGWADKLIEQLATQFRFVSKSPAETLADFERETGLDVPGDVESLGGDSFALAAGDGFDPSKIFEAPARWPVAARIKGDPDKIEAALAKLRAALPAADAKLLLSRRVGDDVLVGTNADALAALAKAGNLGDTERFRDVVPDADKATSVFFINFDADNWLVKLMDSDKDRADADPLEALGYTVWADGDRERTLARLTSED